MANIDPFNIPIGDWNQKRCSGYMGETTMKILRVGPVEYHRRASRRKRHARYRRGKTGVRPRKRDR